jgi:hypothetical protein
MPVVNVVHRLDADKIGTIAINCYTRLSICARVQAIQRGPGGRTRRSNEPNALRQSTQPCAIRLSELVQRRFPARVDGVECMAYECDCHLQVRCGIHNRMTSSNAAVKRLPANAYVCSLRSQGGINERGISQSQQPQLRRQLSLH